MAHGGPTGGTRVPPDYVLLHVFHRASATPSRQPGSGRAPSFGFASSFPSPGGGEVRAGFLTPSAASFGLEFYDRFRPSEIFGGGGTVGSASIWEAGGFECLCLGCAGRRLCWGRGRSEG